MVDEITGRDELGPIADSTRISRRRFRRSKGGLTGIIGLVLVAAVVLFALIGPYLIGFDPNQQDLAARLLPPMTEADGALHVLGTDGLGRDLFARSAAGARTSLGVAGMAMILGGVIGTAAGLIAGYFGGARDNVIMRLVDAQLAIPNLVFAMLIASVLGRGLGNTVLALGFTAWATFARLLRAEVAGVRARPFVEASETVGVKTTRMLRVHILPNVISTLVVVGTLELGRMILVESSLSFLGLGVQPPDASWGSMIREGQEYVYTAWWIATVPGLFIMITVLGMNLLGDWVRDVMDPRAKGNKSK
jgi:peptide/nickel transport system permease protein